MDVLKTLLPIFGIVFLGMLAFRTEFVAISSETLNQFTYRVALPALLFSRLVQIDIHQITLPIVYGTCLAISVMYFFSYLFFVFVLKKSRQQSVILTLLSNFYNAGFMGLPILILLFPGDMLVTAVSVLITIFSVFILLFADAHLQYVEGVHCSVLSFVQKIITTLVQNPIVLVSIVGVLWNILGLPLPKPFLNMTVMLGAAAAPCALFCIGIILMSQLSISEGFVSGWFVDHLSVHIIKLVVQPLVMYFCLIFLGESGKIIGVIVFLTCMPAGIAAYVIAEKHHAHIRDTSLDIFVNTILSVITIPIVVYLLRQAGDL